MPCIHLSRAAVDTSVKCTLRSPGPSFVRLRLPWRPGIHGFKTRLFWMHGTARCRRLCDYGDSYAVFKSAAVRARY
ncbi:DUF1472 domain-containing protein [Salmonella enterica subsp. enterica]|nr:DUF1472 domain-containing protein [Salmonella enterica subsp. enterica]EEJ6214496.1 DUF1472 domain-containing protein [Salmonella enterica]